MTRFLPKLKRIKTARNKQERGETIVLDKNLVTLYLYRLMCLRKARTLT
jgi:hypothetical protein